MKLTEYKTVFAISLAGLITAGVARALFAQDLYNRVPFVSEMNATLPDSCEIRTRLGVEKGFDFVSFYTIPIWAEGVLNVSQGENVWREVSDELLVPAQLDSLGSVLTTEIEGTCLGGTAEINRTILAPIGVILQCDGFAVMTLWSSAFHPYSPSHGKSSILKREGVEFLHGNGDVIYAQRVLKEKGFNPGPVDGKLGQSTEAAIKEFQKTVRLEVNGLLDEPTRASLLLLSEVAVKVAR